MADGNVLEVAREEAQNVWQIKNWQVLPEYRPLVNSLEVENQDNHYFD